MQVPNEDEPELDAPDVAELVAYMKRKKISRMKLTLEALDAPSRAGTSVAVAEREMSLTDDSVPSDLGLEGVFILARL